KTFRNGMLPTVYYKVAAFLKPEQRRMFKAEIQGSVERGEAPVLEGGTDVGTVGINPVDAQLLESRAFSVESICRWFRVPPWMVGHTEKSTSWGTGIEQQMIGFLTFTLGPWLRRIEQSISKDLMT
ncbi:phage portal protein, partial [Glaesserella parasuis]